MKSINIHGIKYPSISNMLKEHGADYYRVKKIDSDLEKAMEVWCEQHLPEGMTLGQYKKELKKGKSPLDILVGLKASKVKSSDEDQKGLDSENRIEIENDFRSLRAQTAFNNNRSEVLQGYIKEVFGNFLLDGPTYLDYTNLTLGELIKGINAFIIPQTELCFNNQRYNSSKGVYPDAVVNMVDGLDGSKVKIPLKLEFEKPLKDPHSIAFKDFLEELIITKIKTAAPYLTINNAVDSEENLVLSKYIGYKKLFTIHGVPLSTFPANQFGPDMLLGNYSDKYGRYIDGLDVFMVKTRSSETIYYNADKIFSGVSHRDFVFNPLLMDSGFLDRYRAEFLNESRYRHGSETELYVYGDSIIPQRLFDI